jgi:hypothetical protein
MASMSAVPMVLYRRFQHALRSEASSYMAAILL